MVSAALVDALARPASVVHALDGPVAVASHFAAVFAEERAFSQIPTLDLAHPPESHPDGSLVAFRAMVQDTSLAPELYLSRRPDGSRGGWGLTDVDMDSDIDLSHLKECNVVWAVTVPGESAACSSLHTPTRPHKYPIPNMSHIGVQVKTYDSDLQFKSTDLAVFVGILKLEHLSSSDDAATVPTLHVVFTRPYLHDPVYFPSSLDYVNERQKLISWIANETLGGDHLVAEWIVLAAIATVYTRTPAILPPPLSVVRFPSSHSTSTIPALHHALDLLLPLFVTIPLYLDTLNSTSFNPESCDEDLHSGWMQLPSGSTTLITEHGVSQGIVQEKGLTNLRTIQTIMDSQSLDYVFPYSRFAFPTDISTIVLCEGRKSAFFQTPITIPLAESSSRVDDLYKSKDEMKTPDAAQLDVWKHMLRLAKSRKGKVKISNVTSDYIQEDFVRERKEDNGGAVVTSDDLVHRMMVARLLAISRMEEELSVDVWNKAKVLDDARRQRLTV